jgi:flagellar biosynthesis/type III secretory pathway chaperone
MRESTTHMAECLDEVLAVQERLLTKLLAQRPAIIEGRHREVESLAQQTEIEVRRLAVAERVRAAAAQVLAEERGLAGARWSLLRTALDPGEAARLEPLVARVEALVRDLELANTINGELVRQELEVMDASMRSLAGPAPRSYTSAGSSAAAPAPSPMMLNTAA